MSLVIEVADVLDALSQDAGSLAAQRHALATAQRSLELFKRSYGAGNTGVLQVPDAQRRQQALLGFVRAQGLRQAYGRGPHQGAC
jgi:outer membrane protein TolC